MEGFFQGFLNVLKDFITGVAGFWQWFTEPLGALNFIGLEISPIMIFSFGSLMVIFGFVVAHLINPIS